MELPLNLLEPDINKIKEQKMKRLEGKVAIVTGAGVKGKGIGWGMCMALAKEGADVAVLDMNERLAEDTAAEVRSAGRNALAYQVDVTNYAEFKKAVDDIIAKRGKVDIMCNNAGIIERTAPISSWELDEADFDRLVAVNIKGVWNGCRAVVPQMIKQKSGKIINTSSMVSKAAFPGLTVYSGSKGFVNLFTQGLALELGEHNINVNAVAPGIVLTDIWDYLNDQFGRQMEKSPKEAFKFFTETIPLKRPQTPEDLGAMVAFLCSDDAKNITGQCMAVCGGKTPI